MNQSHSLSSQPLRADIDENYVASVLMELLNTPSPTGYTHHVMKRIEVEATQLGYSFELTRKGCGVIRVPGTNRDSGKVIGLSAHVDTLGAMVRSIHSDGTLRLTSVGGFMMQSMENEYCQIHTRSGKVYTGTIMSNHPSVHVYSDARDYRREEANMIVRIDEPVHSKQDTEQLGIRTGDYVSFDARPVRLPNGYIKSRHLDDKASVSALFGMLESMKRTGWQPLHDTVIFITNYEEIGHGASYIPQEITEMIAVDMGCIGDDLACKETDVSICAKDSSGPYDYMMTSRLIALAEREGIDYAVDVYPHYGSDASAALRGGNNIRAALIGPGVHASHAMERTHLKAVLNTARLAAAYITEA
ncbi:M42 family metallopeptidase [Paenibacillus melissococcoides]|uniref:M42 family metallopeptidase n=1 Tax=Paenibacillus melissococcoides TaxID=2912268 RepID=A0ABN8U7K5_9BACL|nr:MULTISPECIES: M42 family metallopeptidase [Paenibacillus]MEB9894847.1 M42 family metallopeptidase [Bacillus cereus]CAH8247006.1 M42 family metallopeptidase [Paenibacillus melissococcoides]CAH8716462.1 M42 family metallopeptidase [Paenibacillus melissococcoides]CAH8717446.1 M42 family metallopeptidase [Paenibacillus melissococcoides]GIO76583.1 putative aminopeptidase YhfE [Paenibacillus dendritiformis]